MRAPVTTESTHRFMERLGQAVRSEGRVYFTGGVSQRCCWDGGRRRWT